MKATAGTRQSPSNAAAAAALLIGCALAAPSIATAAKNAGKDCNGNLTDLHSLEMSVEALTINVVEHLPTDTSADFRESLDPMDANVRAAAPTLSLTPRVASILDQAFSTGSGDSGAKAAESKPEDQTSPLADSSAGHPGIKISADEAAPVADEVAADDEFDNPRIHERMYRNDI